ncbi:MAG: DUF6273 domain-containing protein [Oscillospiraceae bacterium]|nr:DUF6273 domain-containing protein [Oscillospiraceae bacterium]
MFSERLGLYQGHALTWTEIAQTADCRLLLCDEIIAYLPFNAQEGFGPCTWENSSLRAWLNGAFFQEAFSCCSDRIVPYTVKTKHSADTTDRVWLLDADEARAYLVGKKIPFRGVAPFLVPQHIGQYIGIRRRDVWLLRSAPNDGEALSQAANVIESGDHPNKINDGGRNLNINSVAGVRPVIAVRR